MSVLDGRGTPPVAPLDEHNRVLIERVRPSGWRNPSPRGRYNLVVMGAGTAGLVAAAGAAGLGARVALVERGLLGGDCLNYGCVPSKALLRCARAAADARAAGQFGVRIAGGVSVDFAAVMERMRRLRAGLSAHDSASRFRDLGVDVFLGEGRFTGPERIEVGGAQLAFDRALIATGGRPVVPTVEGLAGAGFLTNETVFSLTALPARLAVVGGGPIGCELAQAFVRFGARVTLVEQGARILPCDDPDAAEIVRVALALEGVDLRLGQELARVEAAPAGHRCVVHASDAFEVDAILVAAGRTAVVEGLGLEAAGVAHDGDRGIRVDDKLRTSNPKIYAAGDVVAGARRFTHVADAHARVILRNALFPGARKASTLTVPWCTFTDPEVAHVGLGPEAAHEAGIELRTLTQSLEGVDRAVLDGETQGFARVHTRKRGGEILGATIVARHAGEMISEITLAIEAGAGLSALSSTIHPYPTRGEALRKIGDTYERARLTPRVRWLLAKWFAWRR
ncbi:MAG TPA: mercuric reductase [Gemmatimonadota bacterium]|nr:mercuric reductase [Gemmatimonadota bacterium]